MTVIKNKRQLLTVNHCIKWLKGMKPCPERDRTVEMLKTMAMHYDRTGSDNGGFFYYTAIPEKLFEKYMKLLDEG